MNITLFKKEIKGSVKPLIVFAAILSMYISMIIWMYDPELSKAIKQFEEVMPEMMAAVGMTDSGTTLIEFISSYLYGMILLVFPMVFIIIRSNALVAKYIDRGSMASLLASPVKRITVISTQIAALIVSVLILITYCTVLEISVSAVLFPDENIVKDILMLNSALLALHLFISSLCFLFSCIFSDTKYSIGFGAGIPTLMYVLQMLANMGGKLEDVKYFTFFTLFNPNGIINAESTAVTGAVILFVSSVILFALSAVIFKNKDLHI